MEEGTAVGAGFGSGIGAVCAVKEKLRLVKSFDELRAGCLVVLKPCKKCGSSHRAMLTTLYAGPTNPHSLFDSAWNYLPTHPCDGEAWTLIGRPSIARKALYLIDTGLEASSSESTPQRTRRPKTVRA